MRVPDQAAVAHTHRTDFSCAVPIACNAFPALAGMLTTNAKYSFAEFSLCRKSQHDHQQNKGMHAPEMGGPLSHLAGDVVVREGAAARPVLLGAQRARRAQVGLELAQLRLLRAQLLLLQVQLLRAPPVPVLFRRPASSAAASSGHGPAGRPAAQPLSDHFSALQSRTEAAGCWNTPQGAANNAHSLAAVQCIWRAAVLGNKSGACLRRDASNDPGSRAPLVQRSTQSPRCV